MKRPPADYDISTDAHPQEIKKVFPKVIMLKPKKGLTLVVLKETAFEVTTFRKEGRGFGKDFKEDLRLRDFTINALLYDPEKKKIIDLFNAGRDIKKRIIRTIADPLDCFRRDYLRLLRAVRLSGNLNFKIDKATFTGIKKLKDGIKTVSKERVRDELIKILTGANPYRGIKLLDATGLLGQIFPEVERLKGIPQPEEFHPEGDVFTHTLLMLKKLKNASCVLAFGCLLHDIGKAVTMSVTDRIRFNRHDRAGSEIARAILRRLRFSNQKITEISGCVENHMRMTSAPKMRLSKLKRLMLRPTFFDELQLHRLDCLASHRDLKIYRFLKRRYRQLNAQLVKPRPILNGYELMRMGIPEGPKIGRIQKKLIELQLDEKIGSKAQAERWVESNI
jgi:poly(A) polymerase